MKTLAYATIGLITLAAAPAMAACMDDIATVEDAMVAVQLSDGDRATVQALVDQARAHEQNGDENACVESVAQAKTLLGLG